MYTDSLLLLAPFPDTNTLNGLRAWMFFLLCRLLRKLDGLQFERVRTDLRSFHAPAYPLLAQPGRPWVGIGKHLCGVATDYALRCCLAAAASQAGRSAPASEPELQISSSPGHSSAAERVEPCAAHAADAVEGERCCSRPHSLLQDARQGSLQDAAELGQPERESGCSEAACRGQQGPACQSAVHADSSSGALLSPGCRGLAIASCCHHRQVHACPAWLA